MNKQLSFADIVPGLPVTINGDGDLWMNGDLHPFITCGSSPLVKVFEVVKKTKGGLIQIQVTPKKTICVPLKNVSVWDSTDIQNRISIAEQFIIVVAILLAEGGEECQQI